MFSYDNFKHFASTFTKSHRIHIRPEYLQFCHKNSLIQFGYGLWIYSGNVLIGMSYGFSATSVPDIRDDDDILASKDELSWFTSVLYIPAIFGCFFSGILLDKFGRRLILTLSMLPFIVGWLYIAMAPNITHLVIGRALTGLAMGLCSTPARVFGAEMTMPHMRSFIGSFLSVSVSMGISIQALMGAMFHWRDICYFYTMYALVIMISMFFLPESPYYLLMTEVDSSKATKALEKFRIRDYDVQGEIDEMEFFKRSYNIHSIPFKTKIRTLCRRESYEPFLIIMMAMLLTQVSGVSIVTNYTVDILNDSELSVDSYIGNVIMGSTRLVSSITSSFALYKLNRKPVAIFSGLGMSISFLVLFMHLTFTEQSTILPIVCMTTYVFFGSLGFISIPMMMAGESYPLVIRGFLSGITLALIMILIFLCNKFYPTLRDTLGFKNIILSFAFFSGLTCIYYYYVLSEMGKLKLHEIEEFYRIAHTNVSRERERSEV